MADLPPLSPTEFIALVNQSFEYTFQTVSIVGELSNFNVSKGKWVYGDIKDDGAKVRLFGTVYQLPGPLEDGMMLEIIGEPRLHPQFGFSLQIRSMRAVGEGSIKKAQDLLQAKLQKEGLFAPERKRSIPHAPERIGLVASTQSAAYADFMKILNARWSGVEVVVYESAVQGESAVQNLVEGLQYFNGLAQPVELVAMIRGGGSADDLAAFSTEQVTRAVAASRAPTVVAIGHEIDVSLAELAADLHASTPSNAAELLFPDKQQAARQLQTQASQLGSIVQERLLTKQSELEHSKDRLQDTVLRVIDQRLERLKRADSLLESAHPKATLKRGFALVEANGKLVSSVKQLKSGDEVKVTVKDGSSAATVK